MGVRGHLSQYLHHGLICFNYHRDNLNLFRSAGIASLSTNVAFTDLHNRLQTFKTRKRRRSRNRLPFLKKNIMTTIVTSILACKLYLIPPLISSIAKDCFNLPETFQGDIQFGVGYIAFA